MPEGSECVRVEQHIESPRGEVYRAFTSGTALREWFCNSATVSPHMNGHIFVGWSDGNYATGKLTELTEGRSLAFTWQGRDDPQPTRVHVELKDADNGTRVELEHSGIGTGPEWGNSLAFFKREWQESLANLASVLETGEDLRITRRPVLGIILAPFTSEDAERLAVPVDMGVRLAGVVAGLGAEKAGLQEDDVIVRVDKQETPTLARLQAALQPHRTGETVDVDFYRGPALHSVQMPLSGRTIPAIPDEPQELADRVRARYTREEQTLSNFLAGVTDIEAAYRPGPGEWSVKHVLSHLIQVERLNGQWIEELISGDEAAYDGSGRTQDARLDATIYAFPTVRDLAGELERLHDETVALLRGLPEEFVRRKRSYWRLARAFLDESYSHVDDHLGQMRAAVAAARAAADTR